jgi:hypothetical protein
VAQVPKSSVATLADSEHRIVREDGEQSRLAVTSGGATVSRALQQR